LADWAALEDDDYGYQGEKRQRGGRKKRKKNREEHIVQNWDDIYDPSRPNNYEEYRHSEEKVMEVRDWKNRLYAHRMRRSLSRDSDSDDDNGPINSMFQLLHYSWNFTERILLGQFAPPSSFAPPPNLNNAMPPQASVPDDASGKDAFARRADLGQSAGFPQQIPSPPPQEPHLIPNDPTGEDAYMRRLQKAGSLSSKQNIPPPPPSHPLEKFQPSTATISRAPVRYTLPAPPEDIPASEAELEAVLAEEEPADEEDEEEDAPRSLRPGQKGFAERLLSKYGWTKGSGLGATGSGIKNPLQVKVEKRKKRPDSEGGGFVTPAGRGKIIGSKKLGGYESKFGPMGEVIVLRGMLNGMDLQSELETSEGGGLMQEIGEECNEKVCFHLLRATPLEVMLTNRVFSMELSSESTLLVMSETLLRSLSSSPVHYLLYG
jgi:splicing factor 45